MLLLKDMCYPTTPAPALPSYHKGHRVSRVVQSAYGALDTLRPLRWASLPGEGRKDVSTMTRQEYNECYEAIKKIRETIAGDRKTVGELSADQAALKAYKLTVDLEIALEMLVPPWGD